MAVAEADNWGLFVDEVKIFATGSPGADWWARYISRHPADRATCLAMTPQGGHWHIACDSREDAEMTVTAIEGHGVNRKFLRVATRSACLKAAADRIAHHERQSAAIAAWRERDREGDEAWAWWANQVMPDPFTDREGHQRALQEIGYPHAARTAVLRLYRDHKTALERQPFSLAGLGGAA